MRRLTLLLALGSLAACGRKSSGEFDERPPIPMAAVAEPIESVPRETQAGPAVRPGEDLRGPRHTDLPADDPSTLPARGPREAPTYTYVPVPSPREIPGEMVPTVPTTSKPISMGRTFVPGLQPEGVPVTVSSPPPPGGPTAPPASGGVTPDLKP